MISCNEYDYIEIACLYRLVVKLVLRDGRVEIGCATNTARDEQRRECIVLVSNDRSETSSLIPLDSIKSMHALQENIHFGSVPFSAGEDADH